MTITDFQSLFSWYLTLLVLGLVFLPTTFLLFGKFWDKGYSLSKTISQVVITFVIFVLSVFRLLPYSQTVIAWLVLFFFLFNYFYLAKKYISWPGLIILIKSHLPRFLLSEVIFFGLLLFWTYVRGFRPEIDNLEKPMDWGFVNSALRSQFLPPADMWFSGQPINYYYFGHLIHATLAKLSAIPSTITYNLSIATILAQTFTSSLSLVSALIFFLKPKTTPIKIFLISLASCLLITFGGNLHHLYKITKINLQNNQTLSLSWSDIQLASQSYWYPDATRFIGHDPDTEDKTIHEFPIYSFVVADLHGHMNNIPLFILFLAFLLTINLSTLPIHLINWSLVTRAGFLLSIAYMSNAWDFANLGLFLAIFTFIVNLSHQTKLFAVILKTVINGLLTILFWFIYTFPFSKQFQPMMEGLKWSDARSPFYQLFILYGGFWLICLPFILLFTVLVKRNKFHIQKLPIGHKFVFSLIITATVLVIIPEIFYIKDIYVFTHRRANTMFKLVYASFMMYSLSASYVLFSFSQLKNKLAKYTYKFVFFLVFATHLSYAYFAIKSNYNNLTDYQGLDGLVWYQKRYPDNYQAINWLNNNISGQPIVLEATGDSYTDYNSYYYDYCY